MKKIDEFAEEAIASYTNKLNFINNIIVGSQR